MQLHRATKVTSPATYRLSSSFPIQSLLVEQKMKALNADSKVQHVKRLLASLLSLAHATCSLSAFALPVDQAGTIVQLFEWSWHDVALECTEFLGPQGFSAVQISPPNEHIQGSQWWTRYQPVSYNLTSRSGNEEEFSTMIQQCKTAGVKVYADAVFNHMAAAPSPEVAEGSAGSRYSSRTFPRFAPADFHHLQNDLTTNCIISNYQDRWNVQNCDLVSLADLDTGSSGVRSTIAEYLARLARIGVAGIRVDAAKHIPADDIAAILEKAKLPLGFFVYQEVIRGDKEPIQPTEYLQNGQVLEFGYPTEIFRHFVRDGELQHLKDLGESWALLPSEHAVVFVDNHDLQRSGSGEALSHKSGSLYMLALVFMLGHDYGAPRVMSSYFFEDPDQGPPTTPVHPPSTHGKGGAPSCGPGQPWVCEHRWPAVAAMVGFRRATAGEPLANIQALQDGDLLAFSRGSKGFVAINRGKPFQGWLHIGLPEGQYKCFRRTAAQ